MVRGFYTSGPSGASLKHLRQGAALLTPNQAHVKDDSPIFLGDRVRARVAQRGRQ